ncbi:GatB/YqeY domain-containing protein [Natronospira bacteriovora]|uniref:GatB/YqeY domain-containing protein n=1 Tax=Natronospira bacteriovora TaxID=3069753 RepID=A0ABU0W9Z2_9GAMM|nr:GatB/YqeY domain-containing protein [Natronospira sp. AB-CW4]MDQ2070856.1 GatB/YqeY domain-containing protein [Natronospira sp. AB-CW4]
MSLRNRIQDDIKTAMREKQRERLAILRMLSAAIKQREVDERIELSEADITAVLEKMVKQRRESIRQYEEGGRSDLAEKEAAEIVVLEEYLPEPLSEDELNGLIDAAIKESGAESMKDMGKVMGLLKPQVQGRADMGAVSQQIKARLS